MKGTKKLKKILVTVLAIAAMTAMFSATALAAKDTSWSDNLWNEDTYVYLSPVGIDDRYQSGSQSHSTSRYPSLWIIEEQTEHNYVKGSGVSVTITCNGEYSQFRSVYVDGILLENSNYMVKEGSTVLTLMPEYLDTLPVGAHTVTLNYTYGSVDSVLNIIESNVNSENVSNQTNYNVSAGNSAAPKTGDTSTIVFWAMIALVSGCSCVVLIRRKRTDVE